MTNKKSILGGVLFVLLISGAPVSSFSQPAVQVGDATIAPGNSGTLNVDFLADGVVADFSFDLLFDDAFLGVGLENCPIPPFPVFLIGSNAGLTCEEIGPGRVRIQTRRLPQFEVLPITVSGVMANLEFAVSTDIPPGSYSIEIVDLLLTDVEGEEVLPVGSRDGTIVVSGGPGASLSGSVVNGCDQTPIAFATILILPDGDITFSDEAGSYLVFNTLPPGGRVSFEVSAEGFAARQFEVMLSQEQTTFFDFDLIPTVGCIVIHADGFELDS